MSGRLLSWLALLACCAGCAPAADEGGLCGPLSAHVSRAIDGDTVQLASGERVRYLLIDTPETTGAAECFGEQAASYNRVLVENRDVSLAYDVVCHDAYERLLAYVEVDAVDVNRSLVELGYACVLYIPPAGESRVQELSALEQQARALGRGLWGACSASVCE
jgi:micrococcal nuclease